MIWAFDQIKRDGDNDEPDITKLAIDDWREKYKLYQDRVNNGTRLFGK